MNIKYLKFSFVALNLYYVQPRHNGAVQGGYFIHFLGHSTPLQDHIKLVLYTASLPGTCMISLSCSLGA